MQLSLTLRKHPFLRLLISYAGGIVEGHHFNSHRLFFYLSGIGALLIFTYLVITLNHYKEYRRNWLFGLAASCVLLLAGMSNASLYEVLRNHMTGMEGKTLTCLARVLEPVDVTRRSVKSVIKVESVLGNGYYLKERFRLLIYLEKDSLSEKLEPGDRILIRSKLESLRVNGNPDEFDYKKYLANRKIYCKVYVPHKCWKKYGSHAAISPSSLAYHLQKQLLGLYDALNLSSRERNILSALTLGYKNDLDGYTRQLFAKAGVMHVMALSGFNIGIITLLMGFFLQAFEHFRHTRIVRILIMIISLWIFAWITGLSPSVTRAALMVSLFMVGRLFGRQPAAYNIVYASAFFLLSVHPGYLFEPGFQLSYAAVMGIIFFQPRFYKLMRRRNHFIGRIWQLFTVSCTAQLATLPLTLHYFHQFPVYFWLANMVVVPMVSLIICLSCLYLLSCCISSITVYPGKILVLCVKALFHIVGFIEKMPGALIDNIFISSVQATMLYVAIIGIAFFLSYRKYKFFIAAMFLLLCFQCLGLIHKFSNTKQAWVVVNNFKGTTALNLISPSLNIILTDSVQLFSQATISYSFRAFWLRQGVNKNCQVLDFQDTALLRQLTHNELLIRPFWHGNSLFIRFGDKRIVVAGNWDAYPRYVLQRVKTDMVVVNNSTGQDLQRLIELFNFDILVVDASVNASGAGYWKKASDMYHLKCWTVADHGAFMLNVFNGKRNRL
jgi:competence protein ComEC